MARETDAREIYRAHFAGLEKQMNGTRGSSIHAVRRRAMARFADLGFPTPREEDWRFTNLAPLEKVPFERATRFSLDGAGREAFARSFSNGGWGARLTFVNGRHAPELSSPACPEGIVIGSLASALRTDPSGLEPHLARYAGPDDAALVALNTSFIEDGAFIRIADGAVIEAPIRLVFLSSAPEGPTVSHPRNLIVAGRNSQATIVEEYCGFGDGVYFTNVVTEIVAEEGAVIRHHKLQREGGGSFHVGNVTARQGRDSTFSSHLFSLGGALVRSEVKVLLDGEGSGCALNGLYMVNGRQHVDNHTLVDHLKPHCSSQETYKGVLDGRSRAVFDGEIVVRQDAQKTDAHQINKNVVLSEDATINTKPRLRILADDVKCTHGATVGKLDEDALFYLRSRGIREEEARNIMVYAFVTDLLELVRTKPLREELDRLVLARLPSGERLKELV
jgi:Fe-S cluster assembly protein SufD